MNNSTEWRTAGAAVSVLLKVMVDPGTPASVKLRRAADSVLGHSARAIELEDIEARVGEAGTGCQLSSRRRTDAPAWSGTEVQL